VNEVVTQYTPDLNAGLTQVLSDGTNTYLYGVGRIAQYTTYSTDYFLGDALGSVRQLADHTGVATLSRNYEPYGDILNSAGSATTSYGFTGEWTDATGLVYLRARYYEPGTGRFISRDVWMGNSNQPMSYNAWLYVHANPVNLTDPSGLIPVIPPDLPNHRDLTDWLYDELHENANGYYAQRIHTLWASKAPADKSRAIVAFYLLVKDRAKWDFKHRIKDELRTESIVLRHTGGYRWYEYSVPGNIHYGFVGRAAGFSGSLLHVGAGVAEIRDLAHVEAGEACCPVYCRTEWFGPFPYALCIPLGCYYVNPAWWRTAFDEPGDWQNVEFGVRLYDTYKAQMTLEQFRDFLATNGNTLTPAAHIPEWNWTNPQGGWPYEVGRFDGPEAGQNERWIRLLLGAQ
jgi:RHS repeat-associated protein